jgi:hypothetical protein
MIPLTNAATDKLQLITSAAGNVDVVVAFVDAASSTLVPSGSGTQVTNITTAATTDILATPAASTTRAVEFISIRNKHASIVNDVTVVHDKAGTDTEIHKETLQPGEMLEYESGLGWFKLAAAATGFGDVLMRALIADQTGGNVSTAQNWFPTLGAVAVEAGVNYKMEGLLHTVRAAGATSHTTGLLFGGTATITAIQWHCAVNTADSDANIAQNRTAGEVATNTTVKAASTSTTEAFTMRLNGIVEINAAGTFIPQFIYSAAPGGAPTIERGTYFKLTKLGAAFQSKGTWT